MVNIVLFFAMCLASVHRLRTNPMVVNNLCTYAQSQVRALCHVRRTSCMGTQHAHRVVVKKNTYTEDTRNNTEEKQSIQKAW